MLFFQNIEHEYKIVLGKVQTQPFHKVRIDIYEYLIALILKAQKLFLFVFNFVSAISYT